MEYFVITIGVLIFIIGIVSHDFFANERLKKNNASPEIRSDIPLNSYTSEYTIIDCPVTGYYQLGDKMYYRKEGDQIQIRNFTRESKR